MLTDRPLLPRLISDRVPRYPRVEPLGSTSRRLPAEVLAVQVLVPRPVLRVFQLPPEDLYDSL